MTAPKTSVIIPHYNQPTWLEKCLASLQRQRYDMDTVEIIVVDNGSSRLPSEVCDRFSNVLLISEPSPGPGPARNTGVGRSRGDILAFIDADCAADPDWLSAIDRRLGTDGTQEVIGGDVRIGLQEPDAMTPLEAYESIFAYRQQYYIEKLGYSGTGNMAMPRKVFDQVGPFCGMDKAEDADWCGRARARGIKIRYVPEMIAFHPARQSLAEIQSKWDRHLSHGYAMYARTALQKFRWLAKAAALLLSPPFSLPVIIGSHRLQTWNQRWMAFWMLWRIRTYRSVRMLELLLNRGKSRLAGDWSR